MILLLIWGNQDFIFWSSSSSVSVSNSNFANNTAANTASSSSGKTFKNSIGMEFIKIPSSSFMMGSPTSEKDRGENEIQHRVTISKDFYMGKYEVTQSQWQAVMGSLPTKCTLDNLSGDFLGDNNPVICVNWDDAQEFIKKLNAKGEGTYRLPTEAEWEYAARSGTTGDYYGNPDSIGSLSCVIGSFLE